MQANPFPEPPREAVIYQDDWLYVCLATYPQTRGHTVVVWKKDIADLHDLSDAEYDYLMEILDVARDMLLQILKVEKVYLVYMDEAKKVHWHLVPRYDTQGFSVFKADPVKTDDFSLAPALQEAFTERYRTRSIHLPQ